MINQDKITKLKTNKTFTKGPRIKIQNQNSKN